jgi:hypothetical protein
MAEADRDGARITIRMPPELRDAIVRCAAADNRTVAGWISLRLVDAVAAAGETLRAHVVTRTPSASRKPAPKKKRT